MKKIAGILSTLLVFGISCKRDKTDYPIPPQIYNQSTNPHKIKVTDPTSSIKIKFSFKDGNQNIANNPNETDSTIFIKDSRDTSAEDFSYVYPMPFIPKNLRPKNGIQGTVTLNLSNAYFSPKDSLHFALGKDTMYWSIYIMDNDSNISNTIKSDTIYIDYH